MNFVYTPDSLFYIMLIISVLGVLLVLVRQFYVATRLRLGYLRPFYKLPLRVILIGLVLISILGPSFGELSTEIKVKGKDIMLAVDLSKSMDATDIQPSRLEKIKYELKKVITNFRSDRIGLIVFSREAFLHCPLTYDHSALTLFLETLNTNVMPHGGTNLEAPLRMASNKLLPETEKGKEDPKSKIVVLVTDGEHHGDFPNMIVDKLHEQQISVYTLGIGTSTGYDINKLADSKNNNDGLTKLMMENLEKIAERTNAKAYKISDTENNVARLISDIESIEGTIRETKRIDTSANKYYYFLLVALGLALIDVIFPIKLPTKR